MRRTDAFRPACRSAVLLALLVLAPTAQAEGFVGVRGGPAISETGDLRARSTGPGIGRTRDRLDYDVGGSFGVRGGYWFGPELNWLGLAGDISYFHALEDRGRGELDLHLFPLTPLLMLRAPIGTSQRYPDGRLQPYAAVGPALTFSVARLALDDVVSGFDDYYDGEFDVGLDALGGLAFQVSPRVALFVEYRFTYLDMDFDNEVDNDLGPDPDVDVDTILKTHHTTFGVSFHF
jgi:opacity protein-like surface antigen